VEQASACEFFGCAQLQVPPNKTPQAEACSTEKTESPRRTGATVNALLSGGATDTGMVPRDIPDLLREKLLHPDIMIPPLLWLFSEAASGVTGSRFTANLWDATLLPERAAE